MGEGDTLLNAVVGAVVTVLTSFLPLSPVLGGAVAGYLQRRDGFAVGALSGLLAAIPLVLLMGLFLGVVTAFLGFGAPRGLFGVGFLGVLFLGLLVVYSVLFGAAGGYLGTYVYEETGGDLL